MSDKTNHTPQKTNFFIYCVALLVIVLAVLLIYIFHINPYNKQKEADLEQLSTLNYNSIFCSMYPIDHFAQEDFVTYRGFNTLKLQTPLRNTSDLSAYLSAAFSSGNTLDTVYLGLDPAVIWNASRKQNDKWNTSIHEDILSYASEHTEVTFEVLLPAPSLQYWTEKQPEEISEILTTYDSLIRSFDSYHNIIAYFIGDEQWLIANPANYCGELTTNDIISQKLMLFTFCDHQYQITADTVSSRLDALKTFISREQTTPTTYPDLSSWDVVFFGDSVIGNYTGSFSIPGVVAGLSDANTYNCAQGGIPASVTPDCILSFPSSVDYFVAQDSSVVPGDGPFRESLKAYTEADHTNRKLCFVLNFGLNDYFGGHPVTNTGNPSDNTTYAGALREGITKLQSAYPEATILLMAPTFTIQFSNGTQATSEKGGMLTEYVAAALQVADEMNVICMNNYANLGIDENTAWTYLADGTHLNETGRFLLAERIIEQIGIQ